MFHGAHEAVNDHACLGEQNMRHDVFLIQTRIVVKLQEHDMDFINGSSPEFLYLIDVVGKNFDDST